MKSTKINKKERHRKDLIEYTKTVILTLFAVLILVGLVIYDAANATRLKMSSVMEQIIGNMTTQAIKELQEQERLRPSDYRINMRLAELYEEIDDSFKAEEEYKKALFKSPKNSNVLYRYALFCVSQGRFDEGIVLIETITDSPNKDTVVKKFTFYKYAGDKLAQKGDYWNATKIYLIGAKYGKILGGKSNYELKRNLLDAVLLSADKEIQNNNTEQAKLVLEGVLKYYDSPEAKYKLALIDLNTNPKKASETMLNLMDKEPQLINYDILYSSLNSLAEQTTDSNKKAYYNLKMNKVKASAMRNALYSDEIKIESPRITDTKGTFGKKVMSFGVRNASKSRIELVQLQVNITFPNTSQITKETNVNISDEGEGYASVIIHNWEHLEKYYGKAKSVKAEIYGRKNPRFDWVLLDKIDIPVIKP